VCVCVLIFLKRKKLPKLALGLEVGDEIMGELVGVLVINCCRFKMLGLSEMSRYRPAIVRANKIQI
jgi:hypothetical protein